MKARLVAARYSGGRINRKEPRHGGRPAPAAWKGDKCVVVVDARPGPEYDVISQNGPAFHADGVLEYLAFKQGTLYRVKHVPSAK